MAIKIEASQRLRASWFSDLTLEEQRKYVAEHPHSKYAEDYDTKHDSDYLTDAKEGDKERKAQLLKQIKEVEADVKEIEAEGDDASHEKKHLKSLRDELNGIG